MCRLVVEAAERGGQPLYHINLFVTGSNVATDTQVISDARRIVGEQDDSTYIPTDPKEFSGRIFHTCYMGTENSSADTRRRAKQLAQAIGRCVDNGLFNTCLANE